MASSQRSASGAETRRERRAAPLRENPKRRKAQQRRRAGKAARRESLAGAPGLGDNSQNLATSGVVEKTKGR
jgi:hypothetical protein